MYVRHAVVARSFRSAIPAMLKTAILVLALVVPAVAAAQNESSSPQQQAPPMSIEDLMRVQVEPVFGASKRLQPVTEAPASVTIVTADDIARYGFRTLADILRSVRGFYVTYDRNYSYIGARGFALPGDYNTRVLILVDGHRMNDDIYEQATPGPELGLDPADFARVEVIRGPASSLYGTSAFFAVVNIVTKTGDAFRGAMGEIDGGSLGTRAGRVGVGRKLANGVDFVISAAYSNIAGAKHLYFPEYDSPDTNSGVASSLDDEEIGQTYAKFSIKHFTLSAAFGRRDKGVPTAAFDTVFGDSRFRTKDQHGFVDAQYERDMGAARLNVRAYADRYDYSGDYPEIHEDIGIPVALSTDYAKGVWMGAEGRVNRPLGSRQALTIGAEFRENLHQDQGVSYQDDLLPGFFSRRQSHLVAGFAEDEIKMTNHLIVNAGVRVDAYSGFSRVAPRVAFIAQSSNGQAFKYLYGTAFRAPNAYELDYYAKNEDALRPETIDTHEIVWERYVGRWLRTSTSAYYNDVKDLITLTGEDNDLAYVNLGHVHARGLELEAEMRALWGGIFQVSYVFQRTKNADSGEEMTNSPRHLTKVLVSLPLPSHVTTSLDMQILSSRLTLSGNTVGAAAVANFTVRVPFGPRMTLATTVRNLFNQAYADPGSAEHRQDAITQDGRTVRVGLEWSFGKGQRP